MTVSEDVLRIVDDAQAAARAQDARRFAEGLPASERSGGMYELRVIAGVRRAPVQAAHDHWHTGIAPASNRGAVPPESPMASPWALQFRFLQRPFQDLVCEMGHWTALSFGMMIERRDQMPFDGG